LLKLCCDGWSLISISTNLQISCYQPILIPDSLLEVQLAEANDPNAGFGFAAMFLNKRGQGIRPSIPGCERYTRSPREPSGTGSAEGPSLPPINIYLLSMVFHWLV